MNKDYYLEYYELERKHWWFVVREKIILDRIKELKFDGTKINILNIGAATGRSSEALTQFGNVISIEYDRECWEFTTKTLGMEVINASVTDLPFEDNKFDFVCAFDIIEHVENDVLAVKEIIRVCKTNGWVFITVPAFMSLWGHHDVVNNHFRRYRLSEIVNLFNPYSGKVIRKTYFNFFLFPMILTFRTLSKIVPEKWIRKGAGSDFTVIENKSIINFLSSKIFNCEIGLLKKTSFPIGVSALFLWKKGN